MRFEFDPEKSASNAQKHGIDFVEAQRLWSDECLVVLAAVAGNEPRAIATGRIDELFWSAVYTIRDGRIRLISVRRSRSSEIKAYEGQRVR